MTACFLQIELDKAGKEVELGRGAFGVVVKGRYRLMPVAIKRLLLQSPEQQAAFLKEMAILRACRGSRYIVPFVGASLQPVSRSSCLHKCGSGHCGHFGQKHVLGFDRHHRIMCWGSISPDASALPAAPQSISQCNRGSLHQALRGDQSIAAALEIGVMVLVLPQVLWRTDSWHALQAVWKQ